MMKRYSLKLGVGLMSLMAIGGGAARAQDAAKPDAQAMTPPAVPAPTKPARKATTLGQQKVGPDGLIEGAAYVEADQIEHTKDDLIIAYGHVEMRHKGKIIRADTVSYNPNSGVTVASGHTQTINEDGSVQFADYISYDDNMQSGVSENLASLGKDNSRVFARRVEAVNPDTNQLTDVIYTPCQLCVKKGETQEPSWSIQASQITQRKDKKMVYYRDAIFKLHGIPVLYLPYMWSPDPELERASGFLQPKVTFGRKRGFSYEQPYLWSISPYQQLIISPQLNSKVNPLLNLEYDRHFYSGLLHARFGFTNEKFFDNSGKRVGPADSRDYLLADGSFKINEDWRWSFTAQHVKDDIVGDPLNRSYGFTAQHVKDDIVGDPLNRSYANFFERYNIEDTFRQASQVGELTVDSRQLINQINLTRQTGNSYFAINMASFQNLLFEDYIDAAQTQPIAADSGTYPVIAPMIEGYWSPKSRVLGGQLTLSVNAIGLQHKRLPNSAVPPTASDGVSGFDTARVSAGATYYGDMTTRGGIKWGPFLDYRHDYYKVSELDTAGTEGEFSRDLGTVGLNVSYPLVKKYSGVTAVIEPIAQFAASPRKQVSPFQPNEDSLSVEFDETTLFAFNKSPGFDIYEAGSRLNVGVKTRLNFDSGLKVEGLIGRTLRDKPETQFLKTITANGIDYTYDPSGLGRKNSDWIVDASFDTQKGFYGYTRMRLDSDTMRVSQGEYGLSIQRENTVATARYIFNDVLLVPKVENGKLKVFGDNYRNAQIYARHFFNANWGVSARLDRDLVKQSWRRSTVSVIYRNDCIWYELVYQRNDSNLYRLNGKPSSAILFRLNLATLGSSGAEFNDVR
ncbi:MAG: LPS-assembly protein LptD [Asticcacaulis sp.]|nr:LPS-assembly protein LptD [Asticcacaulis sp.]